MKDAYVRSHVRSLILAQWCACVCFCRAVNLCLFPSSMSWDMFSYFVLTQFWANYYHEPTSHHCLLRESPQTFPNHAVVIWGSFPSYELVSSSCKRYTTVMHLEAQDFQQKQFGSLNVLITHPYQKMFCSQGRKQRNINTDHCP